MSEVKKEEAVEMDMKKATVAMDVPHQVISLGIPVEAWHEMSPEDRSMEIMQAVGQELRHTLLACEEIDSDTVEGDDA